MSSAAQSAPASSAPSSAPAVTTAASTTPPSPTGTATSASQTSPTASASGATASIGSFTSRISVILKFSAVDDQVSLNVNGADIVVSGIVIETQPALVADLTPYLRVGANAVRVTGYNKTYLATLKGTLSVDTKVVKAWNLHSGDQKTFLDNTFTVNYQPAGTAVTPAAAVDLGAVKAASVKFAQIDDLLNVSVNGVQVLTHGLVRMNGGDVSLDLTPYLKAGTNQIRIIAINELGSGALIGSVTADGKVVKTYKIGGDSRYHHRPFVDDTYTLTH